MLDREESRACLTRLLSKVDGEAEAWLGGGDLAITRFAQNAITQNVTESDTVVSLRVVDGKRTGRASTNRLDDAGLAACVRQAREAAASARPIEDLLSVPGLQTHRELPIHDVATALTDGARRAEVVREAVESARREGCSASGYYQTDQGSIEDYEGPTPMAVANTSGLFAYHRRSRCVFSLTVERDGVSGWAQGGASRAGDVDTRSLTRRAIAKALAARDPIAVPAEKTTVLLEPEAVSNLLLFLHEGFSSAAVDEGRSFLTSHSGATLGCAHVSIADDAFHPLSMGTPFDWEGMPRRRVPLVQKGVVKGVLYSRAGAARHGVEPTGHSLAVPSALDSMASNLVMEGTRESFDSIVARTERAILVTRFWYCRLVDRRRVIVTGMTRDGTFLVEGGKIARAVKNMRFNVSVLDVLAAVEAVGTQEWASGSVVPGLRVGGFGFTSSTTF